jgi:hypothetical protein
MLDAEVLIGQRANRNASYGHKGLVVLERGTVARAQLADKTLYGGCVCVCV